MKNQALIKTAGAVAAVSLLFLPVAGCGSFSFSGIDIIFKDNGNAIFKIMLSLSILCGVAIVFINKKSQSFLLSALGLVLLLSLYGYAKWKMRAGGDNNSMMLDAAIEVKLGAYLGLLGFIAGAVLSRMNKEVLSPDATPATKNTEEGTM